MMDLQNVSVILLHSFNWKYLDACCDLLNEEWPRSTTARMHSLKASCDNLPTSLILLLSEPDTGDRLVIGHSKISSMHNYPTACFLESVVVQKKFRGKGWGKYIMRETEEFVKRKGRTVIFLTTTDKVEFYSKLGYEKCEPVSIYGCKSFKMNTFNCLRRIPLMPSFSGQVRPPPAPPPPPPPKKLDVKVYMMKILP